MGEKTLISFLKLVPHILRNFTGQNGIAVENLKMEIQDLCDPFVKPALFRLRLELDMFFQEWLSSDLVCKFRCLIR